MYLLFGSSIKVVFQDNLKQNICSAPGEMKFIKWWTLMNVHDIHEHSSMVHQAQMKFMTIMNINKHLMN